jgi:hypothetical protein
MPQTTMSRTARLWAVLVANLALVGALIGVGITAHSLGVWAEGADYLTGRPTGSTPAIDGSSKTLSE